MGFVEKRKKHFAPRSSSDWSRIGNRHDRIYFSGDFFSNKHWANELLYADDTLLIDSRNDSLQFFRDFIQERKKMESLAINYDTKITDPNNKKIAKTNPLLTWEHYSQVMDASHLNSADESGWLVKTSRIYLRYDVMLDYELHQKKESLKPSLSIN